MTNATNFDFDSILDKSIDDLKDLPEFKVPDTGIYGLSVKCSTKAINDKPAVSADFTVRHIVELAESSTPEDQRAKPGDSFNIAFILKDNSGNDSEMAWGRLKEFVKPFQAHFGENNLRAVVAKLTEESVDITAKVTKRARKDDKEKFDAKVENITVD